MVGYFEYDIGCLGLKVLPTKAVTSVIVRTTMQIDTQWFMIQDNISTLFVMK